MSPREPSPRKAQVETKLPTHAKETNTSHISATFAANPHSAGDPRCAGRMLHKAPIQQSILYTGQKPHDTTILVQNVGGGFLPDAEEALALVATIM